MPVMAECSKQFATDPAAPTLLLHRLVQKFGEGNWSPIARALNEAFGKTEDQGRIGKQCRERW